MRNTMTYFETSCKTGDNVSNLFEQIASDLIHLHHPQLVEYFLQFIRISFSFSVLAQNPSISK
jgi:GTPase SAR1 family protein